MNEYDKIEKINNIIRQLYWHIGIERLKLSLFKFKFNSRIFITSFLGIGDADNELHQGHNICFTLLFSSLLTVLFYAFTSFHDTVATVVFSVVWFFVACLLISLILVMLNFLNPINNHDIIKMVYPFRTIIFNNIPQNEDTKPIILLIKYYDKYKKLPADDMGLLDNVYYVEAAIHRFLLNTKNSIKAELESSLLNDDDDEYI